MKKHTGPITCGVFYHIYNRGINGESLFKESRNYAYFLQQYAKYMPSVVETYAYCLMNNHFHLLIKTRSAEEIFHNTKQLHKFHHTLSPTDPDYEIIASKQISRQFSKFFNSYAQAINKSCQRTGGLFEEPFRRLPVENESHLLQLVYYIHTNPQKHGFVEDFREYPYSSYHTHLSKLDTKLRRIELLDWFGDTEHFQKYHLANQVLTDLEKFEIDFDVF